MTQVFSIKNLITLGALVSFSNALICQWGGYCLSNSDCVAGNTCKIQNQYYSQCVPQTQTNCIAAYSQCGGVGYGGLNTCCEGSACIVQNAYYSQCVPQVVSCSNPTGFPTSTVSVSGSPTGNPSFRPSALPSFTWTSAPSTNPSSAPSTAPVTNPSLTPVANPTIYPTKAPVSYASDHLPIRRLLQDLR